MNVIFGNLKVFEVRFRPRPIRVALVSEHCVGLPIVLEADHVVGEPVVELWLQEFNVVPAQESIIQHFKIDEKIVLAYEWAECKHAIIYKSRSKWLF